MNRRSFVKQTSAAGLILGMSGLPWTSLARDDRDFSRLTILHTNDVHSRIEAFPNDHSRYAGRGGVFNRMHLIERIRQEEEHVLLLDAGDIFQGTPYFNMFGGAVEMKSMSVMGYDAATLGNHDFDAGIDGLAKQMKYAKFSMLNCNYRMEDTALFGMTQSYQVLEKSGLKIGLTGVGIELEGLVPSALFKGIVVESAVEQVNKTARFLKKERACDLVIVLSHLGYHYHSSKIDDKKLARQSQCVDLIIGGHTHSFLDKPVVVKNMDDLPVIINQVGWAGLMLGRIDFRFQKDRKAHCFYCENKWVEWLD